VGTLLEALQGQDDDFGKHVIPGMTGKHRDIYVYDYEKENKLEDFKVEVKDGIREKILVDKTRDSSYWKDVGTIDSYYEASMDLVGVDPLFNLYGERWPIRTYQRPLPPSKCVLGGKTPQSIVCDGCIISDGTVWNSILSPGVIVERDAVVEQSVIFDDVIIEPGARIRRAIVDKESRIRAGASIGYDREADTRRGCTISDNGIVVVAKGTDISRTDRAIAFLAILFLQLTGGAACWCIQLSPLARSLMTRLSHRMPSWEDRRWIYDELIEMEEKLARTDYKDIFRLESVDNLIHKVHFAPIEVTNTHL
jgi:ADP-glucose pyrophosphorylase